MLCEKCNETEATIHLTQVVDGAVKKLHLCEDCASDSGFDIHGPMSITDLLIGMGGQQPAEQTISTEERACPSCHMRKSDFKKTGRLGCPACYETFAEDLPQLLKAMHRSEQHVGKVPAREGVRVQVSAELAGLQKELNTAVAAEQFEEAAKIRDAIKTCKAKLVEESQKEAS